MGIEKFTFQNFFFQILPESTEEIFKLSSENISTKKKL